MKEYQFKIPNGVWVDVNANTKAEAVKLLNGALHLLDEPFTGPGPIVRVQVDTRTRVSRKNIVSVYDLEKGSGPEFFRLDEEGNDLE